MIQIEKKLVSESPYKLAREFSKVLDEHFSRRGQPVTRDALEAFKSSIVSSQTNRDADVYYFVESLATGEILDHGRQKQFNFRLPKFYEIVSRMRPFDGTVFYGIQIRFRESLCFDLEFSNAFRRGGFLDLIFTVDDYIVEEKTTALFNGREQTPGALAHLWTIRHQDETQRITKPIIRDEFFRPIHLLSELFLSTCIGFIKDATTLTAREWQIALLGAKDRTRNDVAELLDMPVNTVTKHTSHITAKGKRYISPQIANFNEVGKILASLGAC